MKYLLPLLFAFSLAACTSTGGNSGGHQPDIPEGELDPGFTNPGVAIEAPIEKDQGYKLVDGVVYHNGEAIGSIQEDMHGKLSVINDEGKTIAYIEQTMGGYRIIIADSGMHSYKDSYHIVKDDSGNWTVDWANSVIDNDWGVSVDDIDGIPAPHMSLAQRQALKQKGQHLRQQLRHNLKRTK